MGAPWPRTRAVSSLRSGRFRGHRAPACRGEPGERRGNLELSHDWGPDTIHDGASCGHTGSPTRFRSKACAFCIIAGASGRRAAGEASGAKDVTGAWEGTGAQERVACAKEEITLPHLRFSRDKRGYENTFVVDTHGGGRRRGKPRSRILYWFRTPPGVRIGRSALDEDAIRLIEEHNPDVEFDWTRILKSQESPGEVRAPQIERRSRPRSRDGQPRESRPAPLPSQPQSPISTGSIDAEPAPAAPPVEAIPPDLPDEVALREGIAEPPEVVLIEEFLAEPSVEITVDRPHAGDAISAVETRLGSEGLSRLRARYSEVLARISETIADPQRQDELKTQAERLNPDTWVTDAEVTAGLESYESVFESLRSVVGRRRRRRRRSGRRGRDGDRQETRDGVSDSRPDEGLPDEGDEMDGLDSSAEREDGQ